MDILKELEAIKLDRERKFVLNENETIVIRPKVKKRICENCAHVNPISVERCEKCGKLIMQL